MKQIKIYTDGACRGNPGPGGWGAIILYGNKKTRRGGGAYYTTNNAMELVAVVKALDHIFKKATKPYRISIFSDSAYVCDGVNKRWVDKWAYNNWCTRQGILIKNDFWWAELYELLLKAKGKGHSIAFNKVKGHSDDKHNNEADRLAVSYALKYKAQKPTHYEDLLGLE